MTGHGYRRADVALVGAGVHPSPRSGASVIELAAVLRGRRWEALPGFLAPSLRILTNEVNQLTTPEERPRLALLVPWIAGLPACTDAATQAAVELGLAKAGSTRSLDVVGRDRRARPTARAGRFTPSLLTRTMTSRRLTAELRARVGVVAAAGGDAALHDLLRGTIDAARVQLDLPPTAVDSGRTSAECRTTVPVNWRTVFAGGEDTYVEAVAVVADWPRWLTVPWSKAEQELQELTARPGAGS